MSDNYTPLDWYWAVGDDETRYWSSAFASYVTQLPDGAQFTRITSEAELSDVLRPYGLRGPYISATDVYAERNRRLALGFDYDFGDGRGVHRISTTTGDMVGWDEVTKLASALLALGQSTPITIATGTGVTQVTPMEWQQVMLAAAAFRQPIWGASFVLEEMNPIPSDFTNDIYW